MECYEFGFNIINDIDNKLAKSVEYVADGNKLKAKILAGYVNSKEFFEYCKQDSNFDAELTLAENNQNIVRKLLRMYFRERHKDVLESAAKRQAEELQGFGSVTAKDIAIDYTATIINNVYNEESSAKTGKINKVDRKKIINRALFIMEEGYIANCVVPLYKKLLAESRELFNEDLDLYKEAHNNVNNITNKIKELQKNKNANKDKINELNNQLIEARRVRYNIAYTLILSKGNNVQKNYSNMIEQAKSNPNSWFSLAFESSKLVSIVNEFEHTLESDKLIDENFQDENDAINPDAENIDESSKAWEDKIWASFDKSVAIELKLYFNSLYKLAAPSELGSKKYNYDTNNEVGVPVTMGANFVIAQLINYGNFNSCNDFINSIVNMSKQVPDLYGFIAIADKAIADPVFANRLFTELANPKIIKTMTILTENGIDFIQSNKSADALSHVVYNMINATKSTMTDIFTTKDIETLTELIDKYNKKSNDFFTRYENKTEKEELDLIKTKIENAIYDILKKYYPNLTIVTLKGYLYNDPAKIKDNIVDLMRNIKNLLHNVESVIEEYNKIDIDYRKNWAKWNNERTEANELNVPFNKQAPVKDLSDINFDRLNYPIIEIAKKLVHYSAVKNELNSINAEGNLSSDIIYNSFITNTLKQIAYGNKTNANAGLQKLLEEITKSEQYKYTPLFWGVKDDRGKYVSEGLFIRDNKGKITINPNARKIIQISLFNGIKNEDNSDSVMYNRMTKGDYFLTNLYTYFNPINIGEHISTSSLELSNNFAGYFMRTPSDAPKNFIIQAPKLNSDNIISPVSKSVTEYINSIRDKIDSFGANNNATYFSEYTNYLISANSKIKDKQIWDANEIYKLFTGEIDNINFNNMYSINNEDGTISIPIVYKTENDTDIVWIKGKKVQGETNYIIYDISIDGITSNNNSKMSNSFYAAIAETIKQEGIRTGKIDIKINRNADIFLGVRQNLLNELNTFIDQLNNVFEKNSKGDWILKTDTTGLIDRAHYNKSIVKDSRLTGNFFSFKKLFKSSDTDVNELMHSMLSLYGGGDANLIHLTKTSGSINLNHDIIREENGRLVLNISDNVKEVLNDITEQWIKSYKQEVLNRTKQYSKLTLERFTDEQIFDCMLNSANAAMSFDDLFEGDVKFYKDAQDFLKRAKEVQAGGKAYAGFDLNDNLSEEIKDILDRNGNVQPITVAGVNITEFTKAYSPVEEISSSNARNGFKAITIRNTVRPSKYAENIKLEVFNILKDKMSEEQATKIAHQIYEGYKEPTKTNDAQSFITIEEFIRRRYADGTLNEYNDILQQIYDVRTGKKTIKDIDLAKINARIQVQKNFYFDKHFDTTTRTHYPRQIKNAEFVLIPEFLEGTELKTLYDIMIKHDIGQVNTEETSKAAKRNVLTFWDNDGNINQNFEADIIANNYNAIENFYYRFLYKQQEVPEHMKDTKNKAGVQIMKKIIDNADETVTPYIKQFFDNYCANIKDDFNKLIFNMGWKINKDGSIGNIDSSEILDFKEFYKKARHEAQRLGLDENFVDYLTPDELGNPIMPNYMNNVSSKLESIAQAIFNSTITRQTLPGWHAAQITQVGHGMRVLDNNGKLKELKYHPAVYELIDNTKEDKSKTLSEEEYNELSEEDKQYYYVKQEAYAEIMIPRWSNLIPKDYPIEKLEKEGLDIQLAYRIPTEGKQSISIVKVVGFLDDVYGSTIVVPDEWVTQTGSDFDVDSVYAICHEIYPVKNKDKKIIGVKKWSEDIIKSDIDKYKIYIRENINNKIDDELDDELHPNKFKLLKERLKLAIKDKDYKELNIIGKEAGLMAFNEFKNLPEVEKLPRQIRNNNILDAMIKIMESNSSREENYSRSNFDDITKAMNEMNEARGNDDISRSTYNLLDQIDFMENATSGASLKAFSVTRDTFNSVNNYTKSVLGKGHEIIVEYDLSDENYDYDAIVSAYELYNPITKKGDVVPIDKNGNLAKSKETTVKLRVRHNKLANSKNNRNVVGRLLTVYSSETTAHILDAIKIGAIYNENEYTFGTFKTLIDIGIDYRTAIAFLMQPAITTINEVNNETNSIYTNSYSNNIKTAIKRITANAGFTLGGKPITDYSDYNSVITLLNTNEKFKKAIYELFGAEIDFNNSIEEVSFGLNVNMLKNRLKQLEITNNSELSQEDKAIRDCAFDIAMALTFDKIYNTTKNLEKVMRCTNPDKFGAKQTIRATRIIKNNIIEYGFNEKSPVYHTIKVGDKSLLEAIYPGFINESGINVEKSAYPYLASFLKYATIPSIEINSILFPTENALYNVITDAVQKKLGIIFTDEEYKEYKQYMMCQVYSSIPYLTTPITITKEGWFDIDDKAIVSSAKNDKNYWNKETSRIFGYEETESINLVIKDIYNPTEEEIEKFNKLTPAQKVLWIQLNIDGNKGIFSYLNVNKFNQWEYKNKGYSQQTIRYADSVDNIKEVYIAFNNSFYNTSPIIRLATMDLIKYAFVVEGFKFKKGGISKIITNNSMYKNIEDMGMNIIPVMRQMFQYYENPTNAATTNFIDRFIRSHKEFVRTLKLDRPESKNGNSNLAFKFNLYSQNYGLVYIPFEKRAEELLSAINIEDVESPQEYIKIDRWISKNKRETTLYKIRKENNGIYLIPLNLLERNETGAYSVNNSNNKFSDVGFYNDLIEASIIHNVTPKELTKDGSELKETYTNLRKETIIPRFKANTIKEINENKDELRRILINGSNKEKGAVKVFINDIIKYINSPIESKGSYTLVMSNSDVIRYLFPKGTRIIQNTPIGDDIVTVVINKTKQPKLFKDSILNQEPLKIDELPIEQRAVYEKAYKARVANSNYYKVSVVINEEVKEKNEEIDNIRKEKFDSEARAAITSTAADFYATQQDNYDISASTAKSMFTALKLAERHGDANAIRARRAISLLGINENKSKDIIDNKKDIYSIMSKYIEIYSDILDNALHNYVIDDDKYNIGEDELYEALKEHPEEVEPIIKLLLECITFGNTFGSIMTLPFDGVDEDTKKYINRIRNNINKIRNNSIVKQGFNKMFNIYIANEYSTNPNVRMGLVNLNDTFGDAGWWESWIGDTAMIGNKQIQTVVKIVNNIMTQAVMEDAPKRKREFLKKYDEIIESPGELNWENIIDKEGRLIRPFTAKFIEDREKVKTAVREAKEIYGEDSIEFVKAKLKRDEWYADNMHQIVVPEYYRAKNDLIRKIINKAPKEYVEYMKLQHELYADNRNVGALTKEERDKRRAINKKINQLLSDYKDENTLKTEEERDRAEALRIFIKNKQELDSTYFDWDETESFKEALVYHKRIVDDYEKSNPKETLDERLKNDKYRESYEWIKDNTYYKLNDDAKKEIDWAFSQLKDKDNVKSKNVRDILNKANAFDEFGNIDARKLSDEDIEKIKKLTKDKYDFSYDSNAGEAILIKDIPSGLPVLKDEFYRMLRDPSENEKEVNPRRLAIIKIINDILSKCVSEDGRIHAKDVFKKLTEEERTQLAAGYRALKTIKGKRKSKELRKKFKDNVKFETNKLAFNEEYVWALSNLKGTKNFDVFIDIFVQTNEFGEIQLDENDNYEPNNDLYGYIVPKDDKYIDPDKTKARHIIEDNLEFAPNEYYYDALRQATEKGQFKEWYEKNHIYNPYSHKFEPLRVWTDMRVNPNGDLKGTYTYVPTRDNKEKNVKEEYVNPKYKQFGTNYNRNTGNYNTTNRLTNKEQKMQELLQTTMNFFAKHNPNSSFIEQGFIPRKMKIQPDTAWYVKQAAGLVGLEYRNDSEDKWYEKVDYSNDREINNDMFVLLKGKGHRKLEPIRPQGIYEKPEEYEKYLEDIKKVNSEIRAKNLEIDNALFDKDYRTVFAEAINKQIVINAKNKAKNWLYLLQEDIKQNEALAISSLTGNLVRDKKSSVDTHEQFITTKQNRALESVEGFTRRVIFDQFKKKTPLNKYADLARNITSAKYMIFNLTGGIANIRTGFTNMMGEVFAEDNITKKDLKDAINIYRQNSIAMLKDMYKDTSSNFYVALVKYFNVVNPDDMLERVDGESAGEYVRRVRNLLYSLQSGGEHFMQNSVLFAVLKQNRIFDDIDGTKRCGNFQQYTWKVEYNTLKLIIGNDIVLNDALKEMKLNIKRDKQLAYKYDTFKRNLVEDFLRAHCTKEQQREYINKREKAIEKAKKDWLKKKPVLEQLKLNKDNEIVIDESSELTQEMLNDIKNTTIALNKKIHGVYDKIGAARIEFSWYGGLVMQYHKHIYPGIMKRYRWKGYYNEQTNTIEIGSYAALVRFLGREFVGIGDRIRNKSEKGEIEAIISIQEIFKTALDTIINIETNWNLMPQWERNAVKRCLGDLYGVVSSLLMSICIYAMTDDDDEKDSELIATSLYIADRLLSESQMYTPWGLISEASTLWSSPIAATNGPQDLLKGMGLVAQWMFDDDFSPTYKTGLYAGENKGWVLLRRNIPLYRVIDRISNMTKNNSYYRINDKSINMKLSRNIADFVTND